jgi:uncharacterized membrane protein YqhA
MARDDQDSFWAFYNFFSNFFIESRWFLIEISFYLIFFCYFLISYEVFLVSLSNSLPVLPELSIPDLITSIFCLISSIFDSPAVIFS